MSEFVVPMGTVRISRFCGEPVTARAELCSVIANPKGGEQYMVMVPNNDGCALPAIDCDLKKAYKTSIYEVAIRGGVRSSIATKEEGLVLREYFSRRRDGTSKTCPGLAEDLFSQRDVITGLSKAVRAIFGAGLPRTDERYVNPSRRYELVKAALTSVQLSGETPASAIFDDLYLTDRTAGMSETEKAERSFIWDDVQVFATEDHSPEGYPTALDLALREEFGQTS